MNEQSMPSSVDTVTQKVDQLFVDTGERTNPLGQSDTLVDGPDAIGSTARSEVAPAEELGFDRPSRVPFLTWERAPPVERLALSIGDQDLTPRRVVRVGLPPIHDAARAGPGAAQKIKMVKRIKMGKTNNDIERAPNDGERAPKRAAGARRATAAYPPARDRFARQAVDPLSGADVVLQALKPVAAARQLPREAPGPTGARPAAGLAPVSDRGLDALAVTAGKRSLLPWIFLGVAVVVSVALIAGVVVRRSLERRSPVVATSSRRATAPVVVKPAPPPRGVARPIAPLKPASSPDSPVDAALVAQLPRAPLLLRRGDYRGAFAIYAAVLAQNPDDPLALAGYARSGVEIGSKSALSRLSRSALPSHQQLSRELRVRLLIVAGKWAEADAAWRRLRRATRERPEIRLLLAQIRHGEGRIELAREVYQQLVDDDFRDPALRVAALLGYSEVLLARSYRTQACRFARGAQRALKAARLEGGPLAARVEAQLERCRRR